MTGVHDSIPAFFMPKDEKKFSGNATVGVGFLALNRTHMVGKMTFEREKVYGNAGKSCKYVLLEADIFPTPTVVVFPDLS